MQALSVAYEKQNLYLGNVHVGIRNRDGKITDLYTNINSISELVDSLNIHTDTDYYITANTTTSITRQKKDLFSLNNIVLDIDCHSSAVTRQQLDNAIDNLLSLAKSDLNIPLWNLSHKTGRGVQLWWCMEQVSKSLSFLYQATQGRFLEEFKNLLNKYQELNILEIDTAASKNVIGYFRLFNTYNTKAEASTVVTIEKSKKYTLQELFDSVKQNLEIKKNKSNSNSNLNYNANSFIKQNRKRVELIENLIDNRNAKTGLELRNMNLFVYYNCCKGLYSSELAKAKTKQLNRKFKEPLESLDYIFKYVDIRGYLKFKNSTIIEYLNISEFEQEKYNFKAINSSWDWSLCVQNKARDEERRQRNEELELLIVSLYKSGLTQEQVSIEAKCSISKVKNTMKQIPLTKGQETYKKIQRLKRKGLTQKEVSERLSLSLITIKRNWIEK